MRRGLSRSVAHRAHAPPVPANRNAPAGGGGKRKRKKSADCTRIVRDDRRRLRLSEVYSCLGLCAKAELSGSIRDFRISAWPARVHVAKAAVASDYIRALRFHLAAHNEPWNVQRFY